MKCLFYCPEHHKNTIAIQQMCASRNIDLEFTAQFQRITYFDYDILISNTKYFDFSFIPENIKIIFGPQLWVFPEGDIVGPINLNLQNRAVFNTLSIWNTTRLLEDSAKPLKVTCVEFPFAIDIEKFKPSTEEKVIDCLIYFKGRPRPHLNKVINIITSKNLTYKVLEYGSYKEADYIQLLHKAKFMITVDGSESQGFALEEAMSCNVPLLVWDITSMHEVCDNGRYPYKDYHLPLRCTSVPYWSSDCGIKINNESNLESSINTMLQSYSTFTPRKYIMKELSPGICMDRILYYFKLQ